jgi:hypothetical protein
MGTPPNCFADPPSPTPTPQRCPTGASTLIGADGNCDDLYQWIVSAEGYDQPFAPIFGYTTEDFYVPHGSLVAYDKVAGNALPPWAAFYSACPVNLVTAQPITVYNYVNTYWDIAPNYPLPPPQIAVANPAGFGSAQVPNAANVQPDPTQTPNPAWVLCGKVHLPPGGQL